MIVGSYLLTILSLAYTSSSFFCQTPVPSPDFSLVLGVDFVLPLSQEQEQQQQQQQQQEPHQNIPEGNILEVLNLAKSLTKPNQTHATPLFTLTLHRCFTVAQPKLVYENNDLGR